MHTIIALQTLKRNHTMHLACTKHTWYPPPGLRELIEELAQYSNNLYNCGTYEDRQSFFANGRKVSKFLSKSKMQTALKDNENARMLHSQAAQAVAHSVFEAFKSYKGLLKAFKQNLIPNAPRLPNYRDKGGMYQVVYPGQALKPVEGGFNIPLGRGGSKHFGMKSFFVPCPNRLEHKTIREFRIIPRNGRFEIEFVTESLETPAYDICELFPEDWISFDPGMNNLVTAVATTGDSFIIDGLQIKSYNSFYNKQKSQYQSILEGQEHGRKVSKKLQTLNANRSNYVRDYINKAARYIITFCLDKGIRGIAWGVNKEQKKGCNLGKRINQQFVQIPNAKLRNRVQQLAFLHGLRFVETEESYTSKTCYLSGQVLPTFGEKPEGWAPLGKRVKRGLYRTFNGKFINADCNGAANILEKVATKLGFDAKRVSIGALTAPCRVRHQNGKFIPGCPTTEAQSL